jgi:hypothetical protein
MTKKHDPEGASQLVLGEYSFRLGRFREQLNEYLDEELSQSRSIRQLIYLAALYHDSGKPDGRGIVDGIAHYADHAEKGAKIIGVRAKKLRLSKSEGDWLVRVIRGHGMPAILSKSDNLTKRTIYRFLRDTGDAAPGILLLSLADVLAKGDPLIDQQVWGTRINTVRALLNAYYTDDPPTHQAPLLRGDEISSLLGIEPGPVIGRIIVELNEAQAVGELKSHLEAIELARELKERFDQDEQISKS